MAWPTPRTATTSPSATSPKAWASPSRTSRRSSDARRLARYRSTRAPEALRPIGRSAPRGQSQHSRGPDARDYWAFRSRQVDLPALHQPAGRADRGSGTCRRLRAGIGMIFQQFNLVKRLSVLENVLTGRLGVVPVAASWFHHFSSEDLDLAKQCLRRVGIEDKAHARADALSG